MTTPAKPQPNLEDPVSAPFWRAARRERLEFQKCESCGYLRWPPTAICPECWSPEAEWTAVAPEGTVWTYGVYERAFSPAFEADVPYVVALVELDAGPRLISNVVDVDPAELTVGMRVTATFDPVGDDAAVVKFRPA